MDERMEQDISEARRHFLTKCGKFAAITPPAMAVLLASTRQNYAVAGSNNGFGNGGGDGVPGRSGSNPSPQTSSKVADILR